jgi:acetoin utilization protein AcuB
MLVHERMTHHPITIHPDRPVSEALNMMNEQGVRRFPVISRKTGKLIGIVTEKELLYASPSPATSLSIHEINYLLAKLTVEKVMSTDLITVEENTPIEEAALMMVDNDVGALPVIRGEKLIGIITETDIFKTFLELFAAREEGVRLTLLVPEQKGELVQITQAISGLGGNIITLGTFLGEDMSNRLITIKVAEVELDALVSAMREIGAEIVDARTCASAHAC